jgi:hypothetical protein
MPDTILAVPPPPTTIAAALEARAEMLQAACGADGAALACLCDAVNRLDAHILAAPPRDLPDIVAKLRVITCEQVGMVTPHRGDGLDLAALHQVLRFLEAAASVRAR